MTQTIATSAGIATPVLAAMYDNIFGQGNEKTLLEAKTPPRIIEMVGQLKAIFSGWTFNRTPCVLPLDHPDAQKQEVKALLAAQIFFGAVLKQNFLAEMKNTYPASWAAYQYWCEICAESGYDFDPDIVALANWALKRPHSQFGPHMADLMGMNAEQNRGQGSVEKLLSIKGTVFKSIAWGTSSFGVIFSNDTMAIWKKDGNDQIRLTWKDEKFGQIPLWLEKLITQAAMNTGNNLHQPEAPLTNA